MTSKEIELRVVITLNYDPTTDSLEQTRRRHGDTDTEPRNASGQWHRSFRGYESTTGSSTHTQGGTVRGDGPLGQGCMIR